MPPCSVAITHLLFRFQTKIKRRFLPVQATSVASNFAPAGTTSPTRSTNARTNTGGASSKREMAEAPFGNAQGGIALPPSQMEAAANNTIATSAARMIFFIMSFMPGLGAALPCIATDNAPAGQATGLQFTSGSQVERHA